MSRCLAAGSKIRIPGGEAAVEAIQDGSEIITSRNGAEMVEAVAWVGRRHVDLRRHARPEQVAPVRIQAGAIASGQPSRDLLVSPEHAILIDAVLIQARALINGGSILQERATDAITYHHIELKSHGVFFANDLPVESYLDNGDRSFFEQEDGPLALHPTPVPSSASDARMTGAACAPFITAPTAIEPIWRRLAERSHEIGCPCPVLLTTPEINLHILADGQVIHSTTERNDRYVFVVPAGVSAASLVSRFAIPSDTVPYASDSRRLGLAVRSISIRSRDREVVIPADCPIDAPGWHDVERAGAAVWRWTDGTAVLPLGELKTTAIVTITGHGLDQYPIYDERARPVARAA